MSWSSTSSCVIEIEDIKQFDILLSSTKLVVVDFNADWCGPCRKMKPLYDELSQKYKASITFCSVNVDKCDEICSRFSKETNGIPAFLFFANGKHKSDLWVSGANAAKLKENLEKLLKLA